MTLIPTQVTFHGLAHPDDIESDIRARVTWLERFYSDIVRCRVVVEVPHRHQRGGRHFEIRIEITVAGGAPIVLTHAPSTDERTPDAEDISLRKDDEIDGAHRDVHVAIRDAFDAARRRLEDFAREQRGSVKVHSAR
jgi:ribosome-associated translation inhibitor RaiA